MDCYKLFGWIKLPFGPDKICHFLVGFIIGLIGTYLGYELISALIIIIIAVGKELWDAYVKLTFFDVYDMISTIAGGWASIIILGHFL